MLENKKAYWYNRNIEKQEKNKGGRDKMNRTVEVVRERERERATI